MSRISKPATQRTHKKRVDASNQGLSAEQVRLQKNASRHNSNDAAKLLRRQKAEAVQARVKPENTRKARLARIAAGKK